MLDDAGHSGRRVGQARLADRRVRLRFQRRADRGVQLRLLQTAPEWKKHEQSETPDPRPRRPGRPRGRPATGRTTGCLRIAPCCRSEPVTVGGLLTRTRPCTNWGRPRAPEPPEPAASRRPRKLRIGDHVREELSVEIAAMMTGEQLEIGHELRQGTVTSARGSGRSSVPSRHNLRPRTWVTARNHRRITAPHTRTFNHGAALERSERDPHGVHKWPDLTRPLRRVRRVDRTARRRARAGARLSTRPPPPWRASSPCRKGHRRRRA